jgi:hypothetical protein
VIRYLVGDHLCHKEILSVVFDDCVRSASHKTGGEESQS